ncbi:MAG: DedA family protein [Bdellovibrio sp.]|nr:DedA family protein [Bdellovibrio sp.]
MEQLLQLIQSNIHYAHWIIFGSLLSAGFNIPVSEDAMLFVSAWLASENPQYFWHLWWAVFLGAYLSDLICYWLGRILGTKLWNIKFFAKMVDPKKVSRISNFYQKYGVITLILGRFIPFGVRNGLFLTAGLGKMNFMRFAFSDLIACSISCITFFTLYYQFGKIVMGYVMRGNYIIFAIAVVMVSIIVWRKRIAAKKNSSIAMNPPSG